MLWGIEIMDPVADVYYMLTVREKEAHRFPFQAVSSARPSSRAPNLLHPDDDLGVKVMEGFNAYGRKHILEIHPGDRAPFAQTVEEWTVPALGFIVDLRIVDPKRGDHRDHFVNINLAEPEPSLFQVPADYKIFDQ